MPVWVLQEVSHLSSPLVSGYDLGHSPGYEVGTPYTHLVERLTDAGKPIIPGTDLPVIERVLWWDPRWKGNQDQIGQGAHKRLIRRSEPGQLLLACRCFLQRDARCRQPLSHLGPFG